MHVSIIEPQMNPNGSFVFGAYVARCSCGWAASAYNILEPGQAHAALEHDRILHETRSPQPPERLTP